MSFLGCVDFMKKEIKRSIVCLLVFIVLSVQGCATVPLIVTDARESSTAAPPTSAPPTDFVEPLPPSDTPNPDAPPLRLPEEYPIPVGNTVYNNGGSVVKYGDCVYYFAYDQEFPDEAFRNALYVMREDGSQKTKLLNMYYSGILFVRDGYLYVSNYRYGQTLIYRIDLYGSSVDIFSEGYMETFDETNDVFFITKDRPEEMIGLYRIMVDGLSEQRVYDGDCKFLALDGDVLYIATYENNNNALYSLRTDGAELTELTHCHIEDLPESLSTTITDFHLWNDRLLFTHGYYSGTGLMYGFAGDIWLLDRDGGHKTVLPSIEPEAHVFLWNDEVYYNDFPTSSEYPNGIFSIQADTLQRRQIGQDGDRLLNLVESNLYFTRGAGNGHAGYKDLYRRQLDGGETLLVRGEDITVLDPVYGVLQFSDVEEVKDWVYFQAVNITNPEAGNPMYNMRDHLGLFRVRPDGGDLQRLGDGVE